MGDIADMMLEGDLCAGCGVYLEGEGDGIPRYCSPQCAGDHGVTFEPPQRRVTHKVKCPTCGKRVKAVGLADHQRATHGVTSAANMESRS